VFEDGKTGRIVVRRVFEAGPSFSRSKNIRACPNGEARKYHHVSFLFVSKVVPERRSSQNIVSNVSEARCFRGVNINGIRKVLIFMLER
jgi:hypothetical protein